MSRQAGARGQLGTQRALGPWSAWSLTSRATSSFRRRPYLAATGRSTSVTGLLGFALSPTDRLIGTRSSLGRRGETSTPLPRVRATLTPTLSLESTAAPTEFQGGPSSTGRACGGLLQGLGAARAVTASKERPPRGTALCWCSPTGVTGRECDPLAPGAPAPSKLTVGVLALQSQQSGGQQSKWSEMALWLRKPYGTSSCASLTGIKCVFLGAGPGTPRCCCPGAAREASRTRKGQRGPSAGPGARPRGHGTAAEPGEGCLQRQLTAGPGSRPGLRQRRVDRQGWAGPPRDRHPPEKGPRSPQPHLVPARQEEVHGSPVDAVPLAEPGQHVLDGEPGPDQHHAGRPIRQLDAAVLGRLVPLGREGPAGLWLGAGRHGGGHRAGCSGRAGAACACGQGSRAPPVHTQLQHTSTRPVLTNARCVAGPPADTGGSQRLSQPRAPARQAHPPTSGSNSHKG